MRREMTATSDIHRLSHQWEFHVEGRACAEAALHPNLACMLLDNSVGDGQSQTRATPLASLAGMLLVVKNGS